MEKALAPLLELEQRTSERLASLQGQLHSLQRQNHILVESSAGLQTRDFLLLAILLVCQIVLGWLFK